MMLLVKAPPFKHGIHPMCKLAYQSLHWSKRVRTGALSVASLVYGHQGAHPSPSDLTPSNSHI